MLTQIEAECDFKFKVLPELRKVHGENTQVFQEEWVSYLKEKARERTIPNHVVSQWKYPN